MNLASKDIRHNLGRFALTTFGIGMLLMVVMGMGGIYRGIEEDATLLVGRVGADLWIVQRNTKGPFAEVSRVPPNLVHRVLAVPGVQSSREFVYHTIQRERDGELLRIAVLGLSWPTDKGEWVPLIAGRTLAQNHFEMIVDESLGILLGETIKLGKETYTAVGVTKGMLSLNGGCSTDRPRSRIVEFVRQDVLLIAAKCHLRPLAGEVNSVPYPGTLFSSQRRPSALPAGCSGAIRRSLGP